MEIDHTNREEEQRAEQRRTNAQEDTKRQHKTDLTKTFEAKLSEKSALQEGQKTSQAKANQDLRQAREDQKRIFEKVMKSDAKGKASNDHETKVRQMRAESEEEFKENGKNIFDHEVNEQSDNKQADRAHEKKTMQTPEKKGGVSEEGHRRVAEKQDSEGGSSGGGGAGGNSGFGSESFESKSGTGAFDQDQSQNVKDHFANEFFSSVPTGGFLHQGFQKNAKSFTAQDLDEIISAVAVGLTSSGEDFFSVELSDHYFEGLKLEALKTNEGIVLKFHCPNLSVRSTFLRDRPQLYVHLKEKNISVFRIDVI